MEQQLHIFRKEIESTVKKSAEEGVIEALSMLLADILALVRKRGKYVGVS